MLSVGANENALKVWGLLPNKINTCANILWESQTCRTFIKNNVKFGLTKIHPDYCNNVHKSTAKGRGSQSHTNFYLHIFGVLDTIRRPLVRLLGNFRQGKRDTRTKFSPFVFHAPRNGEIFLFFSQFESWDRKRLSHTQKKVLHLTGKHMYSCPLPTVKSSL